MWFVVHFTSENSVEAVPAQWVINESLCYWPDRSASTDEIKKFIKKKELPKSGWLKCDARVMGPPYDNLRRAKEKCKRAEETSDLNSEAENLETRPRATASSSKRTKQWQTFPEPPMSSPGSSSDSPDAQMRANDGIEVTLEAMHASTAQDVVQQMVLPNETCQSSTWTPSSGFELYVVRTLKLLEEITIGIAERVTALEEDIRSQATKHTSGSPNAADAPGPQMSTDSLLAIFPMKTSADVISVEEALQEESYADKLIGQLQLVGGNSAKECVTRLLRLMFADALAAQYNWKGLKGKESFSNLRLKEVIFKTMRKRRYASVTDKEIEEFIKDWLRHAPARAEPKPKKNTGAPVHEETAERPIL